MLVAVSLTAVLVTLLPTLRELARAARSAEKLFDTLSRELPPTLESIRLTGLELTDLTEDVGQGVESAGRVVKQVDQSLSGVRQQAKKVQKTTRSVLVGLSAAWQSFTQTASPQPTGDRVPTRSISDALEPPYLEPPYLEPPYYLSHADDLDRAAEDYPAASDATDVTDALKALQPQSCYRETDDYVDPR